MVRFFLITLSTLVIFSLTSLIAAYSDDIDFMFLKAVKDGDLNKIKELLDLEAKINAKDYFKRMRGGFGHYVGMAVHDVGGSPRVLKPGMVFANEPLVVYADENLGVRVEDTILITEDGCENLTAGIPRTVEEIEAIMKKEGAVQVMKKKGAY